MLVVSTLDVISTALAGVSIVVAIIALLRGERATRAAIRSADAADRSAQEAARANEIAEAEAAAAQADRDARRHVWSIERTDRRGYRLRNQGTDLATNVAVDMGDFPAGLARGLPSGVDLQAGETSDTFMIFEVAEVQTPSSVLVTCDQHEPRRVALPA